MEDSAREHLLESLIGVSASRRTYYSEYRENERRLDRAIASVAMISGALCNTTRGVGCLAQAVVEVALQHFDASLAVLVLHAPEAARWGMRRTARGVEPLNAVADLAEIEGAITQVLGQQTLVIREAGAGTRVLGAPMLLSDQVVGALVVALQAGFTMDERELSVLRTLANQAAVAVENARLYEESERLRAQALALYEDALRQKTELEEKNRQLAKARHRLAAARQNEILNSERARIARDLHDSVAQHLISIGMNLEWCRVQLDPQSPVYERICNAKEMARSAVTRMRATIFQLSPINGSNGAPSSLVAALRELTIDFEKTTNLSVQLQTADVPPMVSVQLASGLYYIAQEALFNAYKHARARQITIALRFDAGAAHLVVADDGVGIPDEALSAAAAEGAAAHFGLRNMRERVQELGGALTILRPPGGGTEVRVVVPLQDLPG
ncbi:MAG: GAF domain-containing sensor histidine kinase [Oscillochloridaceae bacterium]|nr:GAF domain-containing sensor histidine kinase [Chloroflexaceae bacterium]MDW8391998.1 GAF domain-containing sensor histidine kinase [Oscillochloridaceae bacterium]